MKTESLITAHIIIILTFYTILINEQQTESNLTKMEYWRLKSTSRIYNCAKKTLFNYSLAFFDNFTRLPRGCFR